MSFEALAWAWKTEVGNAGRKLVLIGLAQYADENGCCFPSQKTLASRTEQSERTVREHLAWLESEGILKRESRFRSDGTKTSDNIVLNIDNRQNSPVAKINLDHRRNSPVNSKRNSKIKTYHTREDELQLENTTVVHRMDYPKNVNSQTWESFLDIRLKLKAKNTEHAILLLTNRLAEFEKIGDNPQKVVEQSIENSWKGLFQLRRNTQGGGYDRNAERARTYAILTGRNRKTEKDITPLASELD